MARVTLVSICAFTFLFVSRSFAQDLTFDSLQKSIVSSKEAHDQKIALKLAVQTLQEDELDPEQAREALIALTKADGLTPEIASALIKQLNKSDLSVEIGEPGQSTVYTYTIPRILNELLDKEMRKEKPRVGTGAMREIETSVVKALPKPSTEDEDQFRGGSRDEQSTLSKISLLAGLGKILAKAERGSFHRGPRRCGKRSFERAEPAGQCQRSERPLSRTHCESGSHS